MPSMLVRSLALLSLLIGSVIARTVIIGDSMFAGEHLIQKDLETYAGHSLENVAVIGASLHDGWVPSIPSQYSWLNKNPVPTTIIMDGGGNDVISVKDDCLAFNDHCRQQIDTALDIAANLLAKYHEDGVGHVIYMGFFYILALNEAADYGTNRLRKVCFDAEIDCHVADPRALAIPTGDDHIHPTPEGYQMLADLIWHVKLANDIPI